MKIVASVGAVAVLGGLIVLAVAGIAGATAILVTVAALLVMVILGGQMGGRHTPNVRPVASGSLVPTAPPAATTPAATTPGAATPAAAPAVGDRADDGGPAPTEPTPDS
ncbi:MAG TPA: hypothetical protein VNC61_08595 [Acidimicrobiales bacterium]|nr:hypothetical protein [Acidimicrobiales bacterium]